MTKKEELREAQKANPNLPCEVAWLAAVSNPHSALLKSA